jgi:hypothetical protein
VPAGRLGTVDVYGHLVPGGNSAAANRLDDDAPAGATQPSATPAQPTEFHADDVSDISPLLGMVTLTFASWNQITGLLRQLEGLRSAA